MYFKFFFVGCTLASSLLRNVHKCLNVCPNNGECGLGSKLPAVEEKIYKEESIQRIYLVNATIQCPNSLKLMLQLKNGKRKITKILQNL
jgi:hypothetical protein